MSLLQHFVKSGASTKQRLPRVMHAMQMLINEEEIRDVDGERNLAWEYDHMREAAHHAKAIAGCRRLDPDLAACAAAIQNIGRITLGDTDRHAEAGYEPAKQLLTSLGCFTPKEIELLATSVCNHSNKGTVDSPMDELVKDVDIYVRYLQGHEFTGPHELNRLSAIRLEFRTKKCL